MSNILRACLNIISDNNYNLVQRNAGLNRINIVGYALEDYIQDSIASTRTLTEEQRLLRIQDTFSYKGNQNNPPDMIIRDGDAIEVKKIIGLNGGIALNSSYPKSRLRANDPRITEACRTCEDWIDKSIYYIIGSVRENVLKTIWMVEGECYAADKSTYERIFTAISNGVNEIRDIEFTETNEIGKVKHVDPLGITDLRVRGMWHIQNPKKVFNYIYDSNRNAEFEMVCILTKDKYETYPIEDRNELEAFGNGIVSNVMIKNPNNPVQLIESKLIKYVVV